MAAERNDPSAFGALYEALFPEIYRFGFRLLGDAEKAGDLAQDVFLRLYRSLKAGAEVRDARGWSFRTAANLGCDWIRREARSRVIAAGFLGRDGMEDEVARGFGKAEEIGLVRSALGRLPPRDRVLLMFFQDDFTYEEISRQTGIRKSSVGKLLSRAVKRLARELKQGERR